jgi:hypothetical protein
LTRDILTYLSQAYRRDLAGTDPGSPVSATGLHDVLQWTCAAPDHGRPRLLNV